jgi:hypothetical protein
MPGFMLLAPVGAADPDRPRKPRHIAKQALCCNGAGQIECEVEVRAGIEPAFEDLQSSASPLCHRTFATVSALTRGRLAMR